MALHINIPYPERTVNLRITSFAFKIYIYSITWLNIIKINILEIIRSLDLSSSGQAPVNTAIRLYIKEEVQGRTNHLLSFDATCTTEKLTCQKLLLLLRGHSITRKRVCRIVA